MKTYEVELKRTSYITIDVEAENVEAAMSAAWLQLAESEFKDNDAYWDIESINGEAQ